MGSTASVDTPIATYTTRVPVDSQTATPSLPTVSSAPAATAFTSLEEDIAQYQAEFPEFLSVDPALDAADEAHEEIAAFIEASSGRRVVPQELYASSFSLAKQIEKLKADWCTQHNVALAALDRNLHEIREKRQRSLWILWNKSHIAREEFDELGITKGR